MKEKTICRGDLFYYDFGTRTGSVQSGTRPVLVIQAVNKDELRDYIGTIEDEAVRKVAIEQVKILAKLNKDA